VAFLDEVVAGRAPPPGHRDQIVEDDLCRDGLLDPPDGDC